MLYHLKFITDYPQFQWIKPCIILANANCYIFYIDRCMISLHVCENDKIVIIMMMRFFILL